MGGLFSIDSPFFRICSRIADIFLLNLIFVVTCLPVITIGASITALHSISMKMAKGQEGYIIRGFLKAFRQNFRQSTLIYLFLVLASVVIGTDFYFWQQQSGSLSLFMSVVSIVIGCVILLDAIYVFALQSVFENPIKRTVINSFLIALQQFPVTLILVLYYGVIAYFVLQFMVMDFFMVLYGFGLAAMGSAVFYNLAFKKYIKKAKDEQTEEEEKRKEDRIEEK